MRPTSNVLSQMRRALCHSHLRCDGGIQCTNTVRTANLRPNLVRSPNKVQSLVRSQTLKSEILPTVLRSMAALVLLFIGMGVAHAQAPIRERSEPVSGLDGARRAADVARNGLVAADSRHAEATARVKKAEDGLLAAQKEIEAARTEKAAADRAQEAARKANEQARAALARALDARK